MTMIGIDLGTTNSVVAIIEDGRPHVLKSSEGGKTTPSVVSYEPGPPKKELIEKRGEWALRGVGLNPRYSFTGVKRILGRDFNDPVTKVCAERALYDITAAPNGAARLDGPNREYSPIEISARILAKMRETAEAYLDEPVTDAVIAVPAYFNDHQRKATKEAGKQAGFKVIRIINEPTAAALAYNFRAEGKKRTLAVYDLGGGTFDISIVIIGDGENEVKATNGDTFLGGDDFDARLTDYLVDGFREQYGVDLRPMPDRMVRVMEAVEKAKKELSTTDETQININHLATDPATSAPLHMKCALSRAELEKLTGDLIERTLVPCGQALLDARMTVDQIDEVILVGGMTRMPAVRALVEKFFGKRPSRRPDPDEIVAMGAAVFAGILSEEIEGIALYDIAPQALGIELAGKKFMPIIPAGTRIPSAPITKVFSTARDNQEVVTVRIQQGRSQSALENTSLAQANVATAPAKRGAARVAVTFQINRDGEVEAKAVNVDSGLTASAKALI